MTAKEKAKELVNKFEVLKHPTYDGWGGEEEFTEGLAKECAIICVDEIMLYYPVAVDNEPSKKFNEYWNNVKEEITNL